MKETNKDMQFYRYEAVVHATLDMDGEYGSSQFPNPSIVLSSYNLHKETPKGYWIGWGHYAPDTLRGNSRWVSKTAKKRYAYPTKEEALTNYIKRTERRIGILKSQLRISEIALRNAEAKQKIES